MAQIICHHEGRYNIYHTVSDGFSYSSSLDLDELKAEIKEQFGNNGLSVLEARLERAHANGHSGKSGGSLDGFLCCNRAGEKEARLTTEQCIAQFLS